MTYRGAMVIEELKKVEKSINEDLFRVWEISKKISESLGTRIFLEEDREEVLKHSSKFVVKVPRDCSCCFVELTEELELTTPNLKEIVLKLRKFEKMVEEGFPDDYGYGTYDIGVGMSIQEFIEKDLSEIFAIWSADMNKEDEEIEDEYDV